MENDLLVYGDPLFDNFDELLDLSKEETQILQASEEAPPLPPPPPLPLSSWQQQQQQQQQNDGSTADLQLPPVITSDVLSGSARDTTDAFFCDDLDIAEMEWLSNFVEESFSPPTSIAGLDGSKATFAMSGSDLVVSKGTVDADVDVDLDVANYGNNQQVVPVAAAGDGEELLYLTHDSPLSVLENNGNGILLGSNSSGISSTSSSTYYYSSSSPTSSASCSGTISEFKEVAGCPPGATERGRAPRTKRSRPIAFPHSTDVPPSSSDANTADGTTLAASNNPDADHNHNVNKKKKKKLKIKLTPPTAANYTGTINGTSTTGGGGGGGGGGGEVRKCLHCGIQKTPQWRAGPMGPKTLCNACGVRYKSGRLFPEYRPAASPTFVASVHSNSHKKVVEMRMKYSSKQEEDSGRPIKQVSSKCCELLNYLRGDIDKQWGAHEGRKDGPDVVVACLPEINSFKFQSGGN